MKNFKLVEVNPKTETDSANFTFSAELATGDTITKKYGVHAHTIQNYGQLNSMP